MVFENGAEAGIEERLHNLEDYIGISTSVGKGGTA